MVVVAIQALRGTERLVLSLLAPTTALTVLFLVVMFGVWRLISMGLALVSAGPDREWQRPLPVASFVVLAAIVIATHAVAAGAALEIYDAGNTIFEASKEPASSPPPSTALPSSSTGSAEPSASPFQIGTKRINVLLTGIDSNSTRNHALNDTLLVVSLDPVTGNLAMVSFPRDMANLPMPGGGTYTGKINSIMSYANRNPKQYPEGGMVALTDEVGYLLGAKIDYWASVNLYGFRKLIDRVGGVTVNVTTAIDDPVYGGWDGTNRIGFKLSAGVHHLDGQTALAYVRSRKGIGDSDFGRARRQQQLLVALEKKLIDPAMLLNLPGLLSDATQTLKTNFPPDRLSDYLDLASKAEDAKVKRYVLGPPYSVHPVNLSTYILVPDMARIAKMSKAIFGAESRYATDPG